MQQCRSRFGWRTTAPRRASASSIGSTSCDPCWIWKAAPLSGVTRISAQVGRLPFNFAIGDDINKIRFRPPATPAGELEVRRDSCDGPLIATVPLAPATKTSGDAEVGGAIAVQVAPMTFA